MIKLGWYGELLAILAGAVMPFAFAPYGIYPLAILSLGVLFALWLPVSAKRAFLRGLLFGVAMFAVGIHWIYISIHGFGGVPIALALMLSAMLVVYLALFPACLGYLLNRFLPGLAVRTALIKLIIIFPSAWALSEWLRGWLFTGFPWLSLGYSQVDGALSGIAPVLGVYGVSWLLAVCAGLLVSVVFLRQLKTRLVAVIAIAGVLLVGSILKTVDWTQQHGEPIRVSLIQGNIPQELKWEKTVYQPTLDRYLDLTRQHWDSDLIIWPETAISDFYHRAEDFIDAVWYEARETQTDLLTGVLYLDLQSGNYYNALVGLGEEKSFYYKSHLVPFTEYLPLENIFGSIVDFMQVPMSSFSSGRLDQAPMQLAGNAVGMSICYEDVFGEEMALAIPNNSLLVNVSNDGWFGGSSAAYQHQQIARMRALELGRPLLRATNTGVSSIMDHKGSLIANSELNVEDVITAEVQPRQGLTPYVRVTNHGIVIGSLLLIFAASTLLRRRV